MSVVAGATSSQNREKPRPVRGEFTPSPKTNDKIAAKRADEVTAEIQGYFQRLMGILTDLIKGGPVAPPPGPVNMMPAPDRFRIFKAPQGGIHGEMIYRWRKPGI